jgi:histidinol phosphatase-like enzyme (inositol monophosphatase family)
MVILSVNLLGFFMNLNEIIPFLKLLADESAAIIKKYFRAPIRVESKADLSPVTIADRKAEESMREMIMKEFPDHGILGEEFGNYKNKAEYVWVLDPIDGTKSFISGALSFGTLIAILKNGKPLIGVINHPILNEFLVGDNIETKLNGTKVNVRKCNKLSKAVLLTTDHFNIGKYKNQKKFDELASKVKLYRNWGDCYGYYLIATGFADIMVDPIMNVWDSMALIPIIQGAGGVITDYQGNNAIKGNSIIATNTELHSLVINILNDKNI